MSDSLRSQGPRPPVVSPSLSLRPQPHIQAPALQTAGKITVHNHNSSLPRNTHLDKIGDTLASIGRSPNPGAPPISSGGVASGRMSAEPTRRRDSSSSEFRLSAALNALDLNDLDLRTIDPHLASRLLDEIKSGADITPLLEKLKNTKKMVTFEDGTKPNNLNNDDVFM